MNHAYHFCNFWKALYDEVEESSKDEELTKSTPAPKYELEEFVLAKFGKRLYVGKVASVYFSFENGAK
jgi:hypothetical protein